MKSLFLITASLFAIGTANAENHDTNMLANYKAQDITVLFEVADLNKDNMLSVEEVKAYSNLIIQLAEELDEKHEEKNDNDPKKDGFWDLF